MNQGPDDGPLFAQAQEPPPPSPPPPEPPDPPPPAPRGPRPGLTRLALALGGLFLIIGLVVAFWPSAPPQPTSDSFIKTQAPVPYEEPPLKQPLKDDRLLRIDEALFAGLRQGGVSLEDTRLHQVPGPQGEMVEGLVRLSSGPPAHGLAEDLSEKLTQAGAQVEVRPIKQGALLLVSLSGRLTHRIRLADPLPPGKTPAPVPPGKTPPPKKRPAGHRLALVIDDLGHQLKPAQKLLATGLNLTFAILPHSPQARTIANLAHQKGREVLVHMPMEPRSYPQLSPGPGGLLVKMTPGEISAQTQKNLNAVPYAKGANNHMGSRFTENPALLEPVMAVLKERGFFFLDSLTSSRSQAYAVARRLGVPALRREIFLDHNQGEEQIRAQVKRLIRLGKHHDGVIAIGHPYPATVKVLSELAPRLKKEVHMVPLSTLIREPPAIHAAGERGKRAKKPN